jgi:hypothetical protein
VGKKQNSSSRITRAKRAEGIAQAVKHPLSKHRTPRSNPSTTTKKKKKKRKKERKRK